MLKPREKQILRYIMDYGLEHGYLPTIREICEECHLKSTSSVQHYLMDMQQKGYIIRDVGSSRYSVKGLRYIEE